MINRENMRLWLSALRSGEFLQGRGELCQASGDGFKRYCCLGVACELALANKVPLRIHETFGSISFDGTDTQLPVVVQQWLGVNSSCPTILYQGYESCLCRLNDQEQLTFTQIADLIEKEYLGDAAE